MFAVLEGSDGGGFVDVSRRGTEGLIMEESR